MLAGDIIEALPAALRALAAARVSAARTLISRSPAETRRIGERLGARLGPGDVVACIGELGAGKTCFLQGLARGLGVTTRRHEPDLRAGQPVPRPAAGLPLDAYRTGSLTELVDLGLEEMLARRRA